MTKRECMKTKILDQFLTPLVNLFLGNHVSRFSSPFFYNNTNSD